MDDLGNAVALKKNIMEEMVQMFKRCEDFNKRLEEQKTEYLLKLRVMLHGPAALPAATAAALSDPTNNASPQQIKKRPKRLSSLNEDEETVQTDTTSTRSSSRSSSRTSNSKLLAKIDAMEQEDIPEPVEAPVAAPRTTVNPPSVAEEQKSDAVAQPPPAVDTHEFVRPQRAAKLKSEKNLKEPKLNSKLRRPSQLDESNMSVRIKQEHEQRQSQMHNGSVLSETRTSKQSNVSAKSADSSVVLLPGKAPSIVELVSDAEQEPEEAAAPAQSKNPRELRVKIKREKVSISSEVVIPEEPKVPENDSPVEAPQNVPQPMQPAIKTEPDKSETSIAPTKKGKKKKDAVPHRPIKVERFSEIPNPSPISSRTRHGSVGRANRPASIYEDAVDSIPPVVDKQIESTDNTETPPSRSSRVANDVTTTNSSPAVNETINMPPSMPNATMVMSAGDATFTTNVEQATFRVPNEQATFVMEANPNATVTISKKSGGECDATFNVNNTSQPSKDDQSMVTAKDTSNPQEDSLITDDESFERLAMLPPPKPAPVKVPTSAKAAYKMPTRTNELFNPLVQSPVKKKVEAFENAVHAAAVDQAKPGRPKRTKENVLPTMLTQPSSTTPQIGKLPAPALGRFLTPTQNSNITPNATAAHTKKLASSASKAMAFPKSTSSSLKMTNSASAAKPTLSRENSGDDFRRGLHQMAEERKKQREQKHLLAAQQREAKEKERTERMAKLAKEREAKRIKKQMEAEQKKKALEEIQRKVSPAESDMAKQGATQTAKVKQIQQQEREMLQQMKAPKVPTKHLIPLPPKFRTKYTFDMLHEDDSTDDEEKVTYKRPAPPTWSRSHVRGPAILMQQSWPTDIIDSFFSVQPMTPDLKLIFPNIDDRYLKRNSSVFWSTPPRYSELPKY